MGDARCLHVGAKIQNYLILSRWYSQLCDMKIDVVCLNHEPCSFVQPWLNGAVRPLHEAIQVSSTTIQPRLNAKQPCHLPTNSSDGRGYEGGCNDYVFLELMI